MKLGYKIGCYLTIIFIVILIILAFTLKETAILIVVNLSFIGILIIMAYFLIVFLYYQFPETRRAMLFIFVVAIIYLIYLSFINSYNWIGYTKLDRNFKVK